MNDELPFALGYSPSLTDWVIRGPYQDVPDDSGGALMRPLIWASAFAVAAVSLAIVAFA